MVIITKKLYGSPFSLIMIDEFNKFFDIAKNRYGIHMENIKSDKASDASFFGECNIPTMVIQSQGNSMIGSFFIHKR